MSAIQIIERPMTDAELARRRAGATEYTLAQGNPIQISEHYDIVAMEGDTYIGCASGIVYKNGTRYNGWMYLDNLYLEKPYRKLGLGAALLRALEEHVFSLGITQVWTRTMSYEAPGFYQKQGYHIIGQLEQRLTSAHHVVYLRKSSVNQAGVKIRGEHHRAVRLVARPLTEAEISRMNAGFNEHTQEQGCPVQTSERHGFVALDGDTFIGCVSGLADKDGDVYNRWFFLSDLFVEQAYRAKGLGTALLQQMEARVLAMGCRSVSTWIAGYEAVEFFKRHGYEVFCEFEDWYASGHSRICLRKTLSPRE